MRKVNPFIQPTPNSLGAFLKCRFPDRLMTLVEAVEKVRKQIFGQDAEQNGFTECITISDLMLGGPSAPRKRRPHSSKELLLLAR
jgi:hypothetical protein